MDIRAGVARAWALARQHPVVAGGAIGLMALLAYGFVHTQLAASPATAADPLDGVDSTQTDTSNLDASTGGIPFDIPGVTGLPASPGNINTSSAPGAVSTSSSSSPASASALPSTPIATAFGTAPIAPEKSPSIFETVKQAIAPERANTITEPTPVMGAVSGASLAYQRVALAPERVTSLHDAVAAHAAASREAARISDTAARATIQRYRPRGIGGGPHPAFHSFFYGGDDSRDTDSSY